MKDYFNKVKNFIIKLDYDLIQENEKEGLLVISKPSEGINHLMIGCAEPILIFEQFILNIGHVDGDVYKKLLQKNRDIVHGAFVLDEHGDKLIFRDTLQVGNLDLNEFEGTLNSLSLLLSEYHNELIGFSKK